VASSAASSAAERGRAASAEAKAALRAGAAEAKTALTAKLGQAVSAGKDAAVHVSCVVEALSVVSSSSSSSLLASRVLLSHAMFLLFV
jgi:hypothetical protein